MGREGTGGEGSGKEGRLITAATAAIVFIGQSSLILLEPTAARGGKNGKGNQKGYLELAADHVQGITHRPDVLGSLLLRRGRSRMYGWNRKKKTAPAVSCPRRKIVKKETTAVAK